MGSVRPCPKVAAEDQWIIELMEERFEKTPLSPGQMRARAKELRAQAERGRVGGDKDARLALADRYDEAAAKRLARADVQTPSSATRRSSRTISF